MRIPTGTANIEVLSAVEVVVGRHRFRPRQRILNEAEAEDVIADYEHRNRWMRPVIHAVISRLVCQLPVVAFRPEDR